MTALLKFEANNHKNKKFNSSTVFFNKPASIKEISVIKAMWIT